ncbi:(d)CMP kinase, partial [Epilithonimonas hominis]
MTKKPVIAIDGFSSTGKSSISKIIAKKLGLIHIDTGALYRG